MKIFRSFLCARPSVMAMAVALLSGSVALSERASAATITAWELSQQALTPWVQAEHAFTSDFSFTPGLTHSADLNVTGWTTARNLDLYASFTITAEAGYSLTLESLTSNPRKIASAATHPTTAFWGYRVDDGAGYGAWTYSAETTLTTAASNYFRVWDFDQDITTTGTVQFAFFAYGGSATTGRAAPGSEAGGYEISVEGSVNAVPEPSAVALTVFGVAGGIVCFLRRRRSAAL